MKTLKYIVFLIFPILIFTGCQKENAEEVLNNALEKTNASNSYKMELKTVVGAENYAFQEQTSGIYTKTASHYTTKSSFGDNTLDIEVYTIEKDNQIYQYNSGDGGETWGYITYHISEVRESLQFLNSIIAITDKVEAVKTDLEGYKKLKLTLDKEKSNEIFGQSDEIVGWDFSKDLVAVIYIKDGYISKLEIDFGEMLTEEYKEDIIAYTMKFSYTDYDKLDEIEIPEDIIENAVLYSEEEE